MANEIKSRVVITAEDRTKSAFKSIGGRIKTLSSAFVGFQARIAAVAGVAGFGALVKSGLATGDALAKTADKLGIATGELQKLRFAAEQTGVAQGNLDTGLQRFTRRLSEAANGTGETRKAFDELGLDAKELINLPLEERFKRVADAFEGVDGQSNKVRLAFKLFDTEGVALVNTLSAGRAGIDEFGAEADKLGITLSRVDAAKIEIANDAFNRLQKVFGGFSQKLAADFAPIILLISDYFTDLATSNSDFGVKTISAFEAVGKAVGFVADVVNGLKAVFLGVNVIVQGFILAVVSAFRGVAFYFFEFGNNIRNIVIKPLAAALDVLGRFDSRAAVAADSLRKLGQLETPDLLTGALDKQTENLNNAREAFNDALLAPVPSDKVEGFFANLKKQMDEKAAIVGASVQAKILGGGETPAKPADLVAGSNDDDEDANGFEKAKENFLDFVGFSKDQQSDLTNFSKLSGQERAKFGVGALRTLTKASGVEGKKQFEMNKKLGIADALISTYQGIAAGVKLGWPLAIPAVAFAAATGFQQVNAIRSQSFNGGGGGGSVSGGGAAAVPSVNNQTALPQESFSAPARNITIDLRGGSNRDREFIRDIAEGLVEEISDNGGSIGGVRFATA